MVTIGKPLIGIILLVLIATSISCNLAWFGGKALDTTPIPITTEAVDELIEEVESAIATAQSGGDVQLLITEEQLTSLVTIWLQSQEEANVSDIQVNLDNNQIIVTGEADQSGFIMPINISMAVSVDPNGHPQSSVIEATVGPFSLPDSILDQITAQMDEALMTQFIPSDVWVDSIDIQDGNMIINGHKR